MNQSTVLSVFFCLCLFVVGVCFAFSANAQKGMLRQRIEPFYWAAFIMQGEWR